ncbi:DUF397 domain-containing protein [Streptomyces griseocarneus]|nr:DUF397 domain-containing protein [Streptomyces griseocarneus]
MSTSPNSPHIAWSKSSYSGNGGGTCVEIARTFTASSYSGNGGANCVQWDPTRITTGFVPVRDSKTPHAPSIPVSPSAWSTFVSDVRGAA